MSTEIMQPETKITNMTQLRNLALKTIERLANNEITAHEALTVCKACDTVVNTVKAELEYSKISKKEAHIPFMEGASKNQLDILGNYPDQKNKPRLLEG